MFIKYLNIYQSIHIVFFCLTYNYTCSHKEQCFKTLKRPLLATVLFAYMTENIIITDQFFPLIKICTTMQQKLCTQILHFKIELKQLMLSLFSFLKQNIYKRFL